MMVLYVKKDRHFGNGHWRAMCSRRMAQRLSDKKVASREDLVMALPEDIPTEPDRFPRKKTAGHAAREPEERQEKPRRSLAAASPKGKEESRG
jgi:hypothetical protein